MPAHGTAASRADVPDAVPPAVVEPSASSDAHTDAGELSVARAACRARCGQPLEAAAAAMGGAGSTRVIMLGVAAASP